MIEHIVMLKLRPNHAAAELAAVMTGLADLMTRLPGAGRFVLGPNRDYENLSPGFTAGFIGTFDSPAALAIYAEHPDHKALAARLVALCDGGVSGIMVLDRDTGDAATAH